MLTNRFCCGHMKHMNGVLAVGNSHIAQLVAAIGRSYSDKGQCCKEIQQTKGKVVEPWPKSDPPPPAWRCECPRDPQPPNYDPYRIKVPDVVVPPLPPSNAKELPNEDSPQNPEIAFGVPHVRDLFHNSPIVHPDYWRDRKKTGSFKEVIPKLGYHGRNKYKFAFHEPWRPLDRMALLEQAEREEVDKVDEVVAKSDKQA